VRTAALLLVAACGRPAPSPAPAPPPPPRDATPTDAALACPSPPRPLGNGLTAERWSIAATPAAGTPCIDVVRGDLAHARLRAFTEGNRTAPEWRDAEHLLAVINAGMFHQSGAPVGLIVVDGADHGSDNPKFGGFLAWDPVASSDPPAIVTGRDCAGFDLAALRRRYRSLIQSYRMLGCDGEALPWKDPKQYSSAVLGLDRSGRVVMLHARGAVTMAELSTALATHDLAGALFLEGGPEASLVAGGLALLGSYETGFVDNDDNQAFWKLPNVVGLVAR